MKFKQNAQGKIEPKLTDADRDMLLDWVKSGTSCDAFVKEGIRLFPHVGYKNFEVLYYRFKKKVDKYSRT